MIRKATISDIKEIHELLLDYGNQGQMLSRPLSDTGFFPPLAIQMITIGEETGRLDDMLLRVAENYEKVVRNMVKRFISLLEPAMILFMGVVVGFSVGVAVCYQILYAGVLDRLSQYATLKAIGYTNRFLAFIVLQEALLLSLLGFIPGVLLSLLIYRWVEMRTGIIMDLTVPRIVPVFVATMVMCVLGGLLAVAKAMQTSPAQLFDE